MKNITIWDIATAQAVTVAQITKKQHEEQRKEIIRKEDEEDNKYRRKIVK